MCGIRLNSERKNEIQDHLDWHCQESRREKRLADSSKLREWYLSVDDWIKCDTNSENIDRFNKTIQTIQNCIALPSESKRSCDMCSDPFEIYFDQDEEEWHIRNAIRIRENVYHIDCYTDHRVSYRNRKLF